MVSLILYFNRKQYRNDLKWLQKLKNLEVLVINSTSAEPEVIAENKTKIIRVFSAALALLPKLRSVTFWNFSIVTGLDFKIFSKVNDFSIINHKDYMYNEIEWKSLWLTIFNTDSQLTSLRIHDKGNDNLGPRCFEQWNTGNLTSVCISVPDYISKGSVEREWYAGLGTIYTRTTAVAADLDSCLFKANPNLITVSIDCISKQGMDILAKNCPHLKHPLIRHASSLSIPFEDGFDDSSLLDVFSSCRLLETLCYSAFPAQNKTAYRSYFTSVSNSRNLTQFYIRIHVEEILFKSNRTYVFRCDNVPYRDIRYYLSQLMEELFAHYRLERFWFVDITRNDINPQCLHSLLNSEHRIWNTGDALRGYGRV